MKYFLVLGQCLLSSLQRVTLSQEALNFHDERAAGWIQIFLHFQLICEIIFLI